MKKGKGEDRMKKMGGGKKKRRGKIRKEGRVENG